MVSIANFEAFEVEQRAAHIRDHWSPSERLSRTGLPPDTPPRLREFILAARQINWPASTRDNRTK